MGAMLQSIDIYNCNIITLQLGYCEFSPASANYIPIAAQRKTELSKHMALECFVKSMKDVTGPEGTVPSYMLFGENNPIVLKY